MGRRIGALIGGCLALVLASAGMRSTADTGAGDEVAIFPAVEEAEVGPAGALFVQGRAVHGATFRTARTVAEVIALHRAAWAEASVDLVEQALPDGRLLSVLDVPNGRHLVIAARRAGKVTEVVRGWSPLGTAPERIEVLPMPAGWARLSSVEDRIGGAVVRTETVAAPLPPREAEAALRESLRTEGWEGAAELRRGDARLEIDVEGDGARSVLLLRLHEEER